MKQEKRKFDDVKQVAYLKSDKIHHCPECDKRFSPDEISQSINHYMNEHEFTIYSVRLGKDISALLIRE